MFFHWHLQVVGLAFAFPLRDLLMVYFGVAGGFFAVLLQFFFHVYVISALGILRPAFST